MSRPPGLARRLLWLADHDGHAAEIEADLQELFEHRVARHGRRYARRRYWRDVLSFYVPHRVYRDRGGVPRLEEGAGLMAAFWFDLRQVLRSLRRQPAFFAVAALTLAVGFAAHLTAFGLVDRLLLSPPPLVEDPARLFRLHIDRADLAGGGGRFTWFQTPWPAYQDLRRDAGSFTGLAAYRTSTASVGTGADARLITVTYADAHYFPLLGVAAARGRLFEASDDRPPAGNPVLVLSDAYWRSAFGADEAAIGRTLRIGSTTFTIIGIAPARFTGDRPEVVDAWAPLHTGVHELPRTWATSPLFRSVSVIARLADGVQRATAAEQAAAAYRRAADGTPAADPTARVYLASLTPGRTTQGELTREARIALWLEGVALLVLLVALANVVNLQMSRAAHERREMAVRVALGADRGRLLTKVLLEMLAVAGAAAALGTLLTYWSATALHQLLMPGIPAAIDRTRLAIVAGSTIALATGLLVAFASLQVRVEQIGERLKTGRGGDGFSRARLRQGLLVAQVAMSALLLVGAGLFLRSILNLDRLQFGIDTDRVLAITLPLRSAGFTDEASEAFYERALSELAAVPGVEHTAAAHSTPFAPSQRVEVNLPGRETPFTVRNYPTFYTVTPGFFQTMGIRVTRGRPFTDRDGRGAPPVVIVEAALAETLWPNEEALGKCLIVGAAGQPCREVVGVATNTRRFVVTPEGALRYYVPMGQRVVAAPPQALFVRASGDPATLPASLRAALLRAAGNLPFAQIRVLRDMAEPEMRPWRLGSVLFVVFGAAALFVATAGVYALLSVLVIQRSREIGVRLALGATPAGTLRMIVGQSLAWVAGGLLAGLAGALGAGRFVRPLLFEASPYDPAVYAGTAALLLLVATAASLSPGIRAARVDPNLTLRAE